jgi:hypothetical protein
MLLSARPEGPSMPQPYNDPNEVTRAFETLAARSLADQSHTVLRYRELLQQLARGEIDPVTVRTEYERLVHQQAAKLAKDLTTLGVNYYQSMLDLNRAYTDQLFNDLAASAPERAAQDGAEQDVAQPAAAIELRLYGRAGDQVTGGFVLENKRANPANVVFLVSDFTDGTGGTFRPQLEWDPPRLTLDAHQEQPVTVRLFLDPTFFTAGHRYQAEVIVRGTDDLELRIIVEVYQ